MLCRTSTDRNTLTVSCRANSAQATNDLVASPPITAHGHLKLTCILPQFSSLPVETKKRTIVAYLVISLDTYLGPKALMTGNFGTSKQSKHQHAFCSSQEYSRALLTVWSPSLTLHLMVSKRNSITLHWAQLPKGSSFLLVSLPLRNICTCEIRSSSNAFGGGCNITSTRRLGGSAGSFQKDPRSRFLQ